MPAPASFSAEGKSNSNEVSSDGILAAIYAQPRQGKFLPDMVIIYAVFAGLVIRATSGKLRAPSPVMLIKRLIKAGPRVS